MSVEIRKEKKPASLVSIARRRRRSLNASLPTKSIDLTSVSSPSSISKTRSTRFSSRWITTGSTSAP